MPPKKKKLINYSLRPAKNIERKMLCESFRRLSYFDSLSTYRYIGMGSVYFSDFSLFHKSLKINKNLSIEKELEDKERYKFNVPFQCIDVVFGESTEILSTHEWNEKTIVWLDYEEKLKNYMLKDIRFVVGDAPSGSIVIVTVNAGAGSIKGRFKRLRKKFGASKIPAGVSDDTLGQWGTAKVYREIITNEIISILNDRNGGSPPEEKFAYKQLYNFHYADGAKMLTVGGLLYQKQDIKIVEKCAFKELEFISLGKDAYNIEVPCLTLKEKKYLDKQLPCKNPPTMKSPSIPLEDLIRYAKIYRYFPAFVDAEIG